MGWWHGADRAGHRRGPEHEAVAAQLAQQDTQLGRLLAGLDERGLWSRTTLLVVSDHGMTSGGLALDPDAILAQAGIDAKISRGGGVAFVYLDDPARLEAARVALASLESTRVFAADEIPAELRVRHGRRTGDLLLLAEPPGMFSRAGGAKQLLLAAAQHIGHRPGMHGYLPDHPDMGGIFLALGRGVPPGTRFEAVHAIDVAPTVAALLGIEPPEHAEGQARLGASRVPPPEDDAKRTPLGGPEPPTP